MSPDPTRAGDRLVGVLVMSHGTPRTLAELPAFYTEIRRGRPPTPELLADLERRYAAIGGASPLTQRTEAQVAGIAKALESLVPERFVVASGARFCSPRIEDAMSELARAGTRRVIGIVLTPQSSVASVGEYARRARDAAGAASAEGEPIDLEMVEHWHAAPGLDRILARRVLDSVSRIDPGRDGTVEVLFTAHSVPSRLIEQGDPYADQVTETAQAVANAAGIDRWRVAWQSAGRTDETWLGPDVLEVIASLGGSDVSGVVVCPVGFVSDHLEVLYDLDIEAARAAEQADLDFARTASLNDDPEFCELIARVVIDAARSGASSAWDSESESAS